MLSQLYRENLGSATDFYQLTMAQGYWKIGHTNQDAVFVLIFRKNPFAGGFSVACGLDHVIDYVNSFAFTGEDVAYLATLEGNDGQPLFDSGFLDYLRHLKFTCDLDAMPEGE